jgi:hypothetical protein
VRGPAASCICPPAGGWTINVTRSTRIAYEAVNSILTESCDSIPRKAIAMSIALGKWDNQIPGKLYTAQASACARHSYYLANFSGRWQVFEEGCDKPFLDESFDSAGLAASGCEASNGSIRSYEAYLHDIHMQYDEDKVLETPGSLWDWDVLVPRRLYMILFDHEIYFIAHFSGEGGWRVYNEDREAPFFDESFSSAERAAVVFEQHSPELKEDWSLVDPENWTTGVAQSVVQQSGDDGRQAEAPQGGVQGPGRPGCPPGV